MPLTIPGVHADLDHQLNLAAIQTLDSSLEKTQVRTKALLVERTIKGSRVEKGHTCVNVVGMY